MTKPALVLIRQTRASSMGDLQRSVCFLGRWLRLCAPQIRLSSTFRKKGSKFSGSAETNATCHIAFIHSFVQKLAGFLSPNLVVKHVR